MPSNLPKNLFPFGLQKAPGGHPGRPGFDPLIDLFYSMGMPGVFTKGPGGMQKRSVYQDMMNQNLMEGRMPFTGFPEGWGEGSGSASSGSSANKKNPLSGMPDWYQTWYNTYGKTGGLLDG
jgi:hypothetical protein